MLTKRELSAIKKGLPEDGYARIAQRTGTSKEAVRKVLSEPKRYKKDIIYAAIQVVEEFKQEVFELKTKIKEATA